MALGSDGLLTDSARGSEPEQWHHTVHKPAIVFTWHHTIPWNCLRLAWNGLIGGRHWKAAELFLQIASVPDPAGTVRRMRDGVLMNRDQVHSLLTWQGWNIVEGPGGDHRIGDPGEGYDGWSTVIGVSSNQRSRLQGVNSLYTRMDELSKRTLLRESGREFPAISASEAKALERLLHAEMGNLRGKPPILWTEAMWTVVKAGKADKHHPSRWATIPTWRKA